MSLKDPFEEPPETSTATQSNSWWAETKRLVDDAHMKFWSKRGGLPSDYASFNFQKKPRKKKTGKDEG